MVNRVHAFFTTLPRDHKDCESPSCAAMVARFAHVGATDKVGKPYLDHVERVAGHTAHAGHPVYAVAGAWLHDVPEDTDVSLEDLATHFSNRVVALVEALTFRARPSLAQETRVQYYRRIRRHGPVAVAVKLLDVDDNADPDRLALIPLETDRIRLQGKYEIARAELTRAPLRPAHQVMLYAYRDCAGHLRQLNERHIEISKQLDTVIATSAEVRARYDDLYAALRDAGIDPDEEP